jgi:Zinc-binding dehydrogenase
MRASVGGDFGSASEWLRLLIGKAPFIILPDLNGEPSRHKRELLLSQGMRLVRSVAFVASVLLPVFAGTPCSGDDDSTPARVKRNGPSFLATWRGNGFRSSRASSTLSWNRHLRVVHCRRLASPRPERVVPYSIQTLKRPKPEFFRQDLIALFDLLQQKKIKPLIAQRFPLAEARHAQELLGKGGVTGKIVLDRIGNHDTA